MGEGTGGWKDGWTGGCVERWVDERKEGGWKKGGWMKRIITEVRAGL